MCGFIAQLVEHRTVIAEITHSSPVEALNFFRLLFSSCLNWKNWKIYRDDLCSLSKVFLYNIGPHSFEVFFFVRFERIVPVKLVDKCYLV